MSDLEKFNKQVEKELLRLKLVLTPEALVNEFMEKCIASEKK